MDISKMTLREKAAQTAVIMVSSTKIGREKYGGIYVGAAVAEHGQTFSMQQNKELIEKYQESTDIPMLICSDFENGCASIKGLEAFPHLMALGATNDEQLAYDYGKATALSGNSIGVNWAFAPVCDLSVKGHLGMANERCLTDDPDYGIRMYNQIIRGMQENGMAACSKHFPGPTIDIRDSHITQGCVNFSREEWEATSGKVFRQVINDGVYTVMTSHVSFPARQTECDENGINPPATLSKELITDLLKNELGFDGIVVTDALDMGGVLGWCDTKEEAELRCISAGCDMVLWPSDTYIDNLVKAVENGEISMARLDDAVSRIMRVKEKMGLFESHAKKQYSVPMTEKEKMFVLDVKQRTADRSITLIRDEKHLFPLSPEKTKRIAVIPITHYGAWHRLAEFMAAELRKRGFDVHCRKDLMPVEEMDTYDVLIYATLDVYGQPVGFSGYMNEEYFKVIRPNRFAREKSAVVAFGNPHTGYRYFGRCFNYVNAYSATYPSVESYVKAITGEIPFTEYSPVKLNR